MKVCINNSLQWNLFFEKEMGKRVSRVIEKSVPEKLCFFLKFSILWKKNNGHVPYGSTYSQTDYLSNLKVLKKEQDV